MAGVRVARARALMHPASSGAFSAASALRDISGDAVEFRPSGADCRPGPMFSKAVSVGEPEEFSINAPGFISTATP